jgi:phosphoribosylformylglycinamidine synthase
MKCKVIVFPGSNCDYDCFYVMKKVFNIDVEYMWHKDTNLGSPDFVIIPGGFSYGDYLRCGSIARFSPVMHDVISFAKKGKPVIGICNGFQILLESGLLPGAMLRNKTLRFICEELYLHVANTKTIFTSAVPVQKALKIPIAHGEGNYFCNPDVLKRLQDNDQIVFQYCSESGNVADSFNPNGSLMNIAGIINKEGNVLGMMPHPERASESILGSEDGKYIFQSIINSLNT